MRRNRDAYQSWLLGEALLLALLGGALALLLTRSQAGSSYTLPHLKLVLQTAGALAAGLVALLAGVRFTTERRRFDLLLCLGFFVSAVSTAAFGLAPSIAEQNLTRAEAWTGVVSRLIAWILIAAAPFARGAVTSSRRTLGNWLAFLTLELTFLWVVMHSIESALPALTPSASTSPPALLTFAYSANSFLCLAAIIGFGLRYRERLDDLDRWLAFGASLMLFSSLHLVFTPLLGNVEVSPSDFLRVLGYGVFCVGVWRAIKAAEFGRAVADERERLAREIHDGLAQYLFAVATHATMLEQGGSAGGARPEDQARGGGGAAGGALRDPGALFGERQRAVRRGAAPLRGVDHGRRRARGRARDRSPACASTPTSRSSCSGSSRKDWRTSGGTRTHSAPRFASRQRDGRRVVTIVDNGEGFESEGADERTGAPQHRRADRDRSEQPSRCGRHRAPGRRSRSRCALSLVAAEAAGRDLVVGNAGLLQRLDHRLDHARRSRQHVLEGAQVSQLIAQELGVDPAVFSLPTLVVGHREHEAQVRVLLLELRQLVEKGGGLAIAIGVHERDAMREDPPR